MYIDKEYAMLEMLSENEGLSQRQLSKLLDISLGSVNMLINKMQKEGLIKFRNVSANSIAYMLTPEGIAEKASKTYRYITYHYKRINDTKDKIKNYLENKAEYEKRVYIVLDGGEMSEIVSLALREIKKMENIDILNGDYTQDLDKDGLYLLINSEDKEKFRYIRMEMLLEML